MRAELVKMRNSRGIRIPKPIIDQRAFGNTVELRVEENRLLITPELRPRKRWQEAFRAAGSAATDELLLDTLPPKPLRRGAWKG
jgi:antitoxin MazE